MDPQKLSRLDPKLRDAYQRVMGTTIPQPQSSPAQAQNPPPDGGGPPTPTPSTPTPQPQSAPTSAPEPFFSPQPATNPKPQPPPAGGPAPETAVPAQPASNFVQMNSEVPTPSQNFTAPPEMPQVQTTAVKKKNGMMPIIFGIVGVIFLVIYTLFWTKIFNLKLPFLP